MEIEERMRGRETEIGNYKSSMNEVTYVFLFCMLFIMYVTAKKSVQTFDLFVFSFVGFYFSIN